MKQDRNDWHGQLQSLTGAHIPSKPKSETKSASER